jgi:hypothetical protein
LPLAGCVLFDGATQKDMSITIPIGFVIWYWIWCFDFYSHSPRYHALPEIVNQLDGFWNRAMMAEKEGTLWKLQLQQQQL